MLQMFDEVRIASTSETEKSGHADAVGQLFGITTPSSTGVEVIGGVEANVAYNVDFDDRHETAWFAPGLVSFVARPEVTLSIAGKTFTRPQDGDWRDEVPSRPWWKFWT
ncbi:MAG: hypothetical protein ACI9YM_002549 [Brevundimonas sp.]|jgi:hypothetical protein|uniref:hypothetical protein n=1 Tax=Brevundimonas sp. TaxID=1871086 RepID=UPI0039E464BD